MHPKCMKNLPTPKSQGPGEYSIFFNINTEGKYPLNGI